MSDVSSLSDAELMSALGGAPAPSGVSALSNEELLAALKGGKGQPLEPYKSGGVINSVMHGSQGIYSGLADTLGAPVDLVNAGLRAVGMPVSGEPFLGSQNIKNMMNKGMRATKEAVGVNPDFKMVYNDINEVPEMYRPAARFGEVTGSSLPLIAGISGAALARPVTQSVANAAIPTGNAVKDAARAVVADAATNPAFFASQAPATFGSGAGAYLAEAVLPGSMTAQLAGQLGGGLFGGLVSGAAQQGTSAAGRLANSVTSPFSTQTEEGAKNAAAKALRPLFEQSGENPANIASRLREEPVVPGLVAGERAQSPALTGAQKVLAKENPELANAATAGQREFDTNLRQGVRGAFAPGEQGALTEAAKKQAETFSSKLDELVGNAEKAAQNTLSAVQPNSVAQNEALNVRARNILESALSKAREQENTLWQKVPKGIQVNPENTNAAFAKIKADMLPEESMSPLIEKVMERFSGKVTQEPTGLLDNMGNPVMRTVDGGPITMGDLTKLRSNILEDARSARANNDFKTARRLGEIADGLLDDMSAAGGDAVKSARDFSRNLNDRFSRSFAGDVLGTKPSGADRVRPELTLQSAVAGPSPVAAQKLEELRTAAGTTGGAEMNATQQQFLRSMSERIFDQKTGNVKPNMVDTFLRDNAAVLDQFPQYRTQLEAARDAQRAAEQIVSRTQDARTAANANAAFAKVLAAGESPSKAITQALKGANPAQDIKKLASLARKGGDEAVGGLRAAVLEDVFAKAGGDGKFSYAKASQILNAPVSSKGGSLLSELRANGIVNASQQAEIQRLVDAGMARELSQVTGLEVKSIGTDASQIANYVARWAGAQLGAQAGGGTFGGGMQAASMGSEILKNFVSKLPADKARAVLVEAMSSKDPSQLIDILERVAVQTAGSAQAVPAATRQAIVTLRAMIPHTQSNTEWEETPLPPLTINRRRQ